MNISSQNSIFTNVWYAHMTFKITYNLSDLDKNRVRLYPRNVEAERKALYTCGTRLELDQTNIL